MTPVQRKRKAIAYITHGSRLLVFVHADYPEAGVQVPAGTIEPEESPDAAVIREAHEESGLQDFVRVEKLGEYEWHPSPAVVHERHVYHLTVAHDVPATWRHYERHSGTRQEDLAFDFYWLDLFTDRIALMKGQGDLLELLRRRVRESMPNQV